MDVDLPSRDTRGWAPSFSLSRKGHPLNLQDASQALVMLSVYTTLAKKKPKKQSLFWKLDDFSLLSFAFLKDRHNSWLDVQLSDCLLHPKPLENAQSSNSCQTGEISCPLLGLSGPFPMF